MSSLTLHGEEPSGSPPLVRMSELGLGSRDDKVLHRPEGFPPWKLRHYKSRLLSPDLILKLVINHLPALQ